MINVKIHNTTPVKVSTKTSTDNVSINPNGSVIKGKDGYSPRINDQGNWQVYNDETQAWVDTEIPAKGQSPIVGVDYWTDQDKQDMKKTVLDDLTIQLNEMTDKFIVEELDPHVPDWAKAEQKPTYSLAELNITSFTNTELEELLI